MEADYTREELKTIFKRATEIHDIPLAKQIAFISGFAGGMTRIQVGELITEATQDIKDAPPPKR